MRAAFRRDGIASYNKVFAAGEVTVTRKRCKVLVSDNAFTGATRAAPAASEYYSTVEVLVATSGGGASSSGQGSASCELS